MAKKTWRECEFAGDGVRNVMTARMCLLNTTEQDLPGRIRWARERSVNLDTCATCPVPTALAKAALCDELVLLLRHNQGSPQRVKDAFRMALYEYDALEASRG